MMRAIALALLVSVICRWIFGKWPWEYLRPQPTHSQKLSEARKLLGVSERATKLEIRESHRRKTALIHPDRGGTNAGMQDLNSARDILLKELPDEKPERTE